VRAELTPLLHDDFRGPQVHKVAGGHVGNVGGIEEARLGMSLPPPAGHIPMRLLVEDNS
jgi:hypothetical protein